MTVLTHAKIVDIAKTTQRDLGRLKMTMLANEIQHYEVMGVLMKKDKLKYQSGYEIEGSLMVRHGSSARQVSMHQSYERDIKDLMEKFRIPWRYTSWYWGWERREMLVNRGAARIFDLLKARRMGAMVSAAEHMEEQFWNKPTDSDDELNVFGVPYWVVKNATLGFTGGNPTGFSSGAGNLNSDTYSQWKNFSGTYVSVDENDLIDKMLQAYRQCGFKAPVDYQDYSRGKGRMYRIYMGEETIREYERLARLQNTNLGRDLASYHDETAFKRSAVKWIPKLDADSSKPVYMLNMNNLHICCLEGDEMHEHEPDKHPDRPNSYFVDVDTTWNVLCTDRRTNAVLYKA